MSKVEEAKKFFKEIGDVYGINADEVEEVKTINAIIKKEIGAIAICDDIAFVSGLPKTRSGKIMRRILRAIAKGEAITQDISTLEDPSVVATIQKLVNG